MNIGAEIPFRRNRFGRRTGSLIFDRELSQRIREQEQGQGEVMQIWSNGRFRSN